MAIIGSFVVDRSADLIEIRLRICHQSMTLRNGHMGKNLTKMMNPRDKAWNAEEEVEKKSGAKQQ